MKFLKVLRTFHPKPNVTMTADASSLKIEDFVMKVTCFSPTATAPGEFQIFPVTDTWFAQLEAKPVAPETQS